MSFFTLFASFNLIVAIAVISLFAASFWIKSSTVQLRLHYSVLAVALMAPAMIAKSSAYVFQPVVKVWSEGPPKTGVPVRNTKGVLSIQEKKVPLPADDFFLFFAGLAGGALLFGLFLLIQGRLRIRKIIRNSVNLKKLAA